MAAQLVHDDRGALHQVRVELVPVRVERLALEDRLHLVEAPLEQRHHPPADGDRPLVVGAPQLLGTPREDLDLLARATHVTHLEEIDQNHAPRLDQEVTVAGGPGHVDQLPDDHRALLDPLGLEEHEVARVEALGQGARVIDPAGHRDRVPGQGVRPLPGLEVRDHPQARD